MALLMGTVATGSTRDICTIAYNKSRLLKVKILKRTPIEGRRVLRNLGINNENRNEISLKLLDI